MTEISTAYGPSCVSFDTVWQWKKKLKYSVESIKNALKSGRPKSVSGIEIVSKIMEIIEGDAIKNALKSGRPKSVSGIEILSKIMETIEGDARFTVCDIARKVGISLS